MLNHNKHNKINKTNNNNSNNNKFLLNLINNRFNNHHK